MMTRSLALFALAAFSLAAAPEARAERLRLRLAGPLAPDLFAPPEGYKQLNTGQAEGFLPTGAHADAPIEWGPTALGFLTGLGVSVTANVFFDNMRQDWVNSGTHPLDAKVGTGFFRVILNAPLVALCVWGMNAALSDVHSIAYGWPYLAGLIADVLVWGADLGIEAAGGDSGGGGAGAPVQGAEGSKTQEVIDVVMIVIGALAVPLAETIMAQRVRDPAAAADLGGVIITQLEPPEHRPRRVQYASTARLFSTSF